LGWRIRRVGGDLDFGIDFDGGVIIGIVEKSIGILRERERV
jgi:hypothetical protein